MPRTTTPSVVPSLLLIATAVAALPADGQTPGHGPAVLEVPASTRAVGLGHAYPLGSADSDVVFYNPALLGAAAGSMTAGAYRLGSAGLGLSVSAARDWFGGSVGIGLRSLQYGAPGGGPPGGGLDPLVTAGPEGVSEAAASLGISRSALGFRLGLAGKVVNQRRPGLRRTTGSVDFGIARRVGPLTAGLSVLNLGPDGRVAPGVDLPQPLLITLGVGGYGRRVGPLDVGVAAAVTLRDDEEVLVGGGLEVGYWPVVGRTFVARIGARTVPEGEALPVTFGASYWGDDLVLEWAYQDMGDLDGVHRVSVGWR